MAAEPDRRLTKPMHRLLVFVSKGAKLESQIVGSGLSRQLNEALLVGWVSLADAGVKERTTLGISIPAAAFAITDTGRAALARSEEK